MMNKRRALSPQACARLKKLGYSRSKRIRMYGEEFEVISDPFLEGDGIGIEVIARTDLQLRVLRLPAMINHTVREELISEAEFAEAA